MPTKSVEADRIGERTEDAANVNFPFLMEIEHPALDLMTMFQKDPTGEADRVKDIFLGNVLEIEPKRTLMKIKPSEPMPYRRLAEHVATMLKTVGKQHFKGQMKPVTLRSEVSKTGVSSDLRGMLRSVQ